MEKVSIIIPVYNSEKYLEKCVDSIINQTYKNVEVILINDGSTDKSMEVMENLAKKQSYIKCYNQTNQGVSRTRNNGIKYATGKYVMFIDNDDYIDNNYVETFVKSIETGHYDYVIGGYKRVDSKGNIILNKIFKDENWSYFMFVTPWGKIFDRMFLLDNNIEYLKVGIGEDIYFNILAISNSKTKKVINYSGYNWLYNEKSISNTIHKKNDVKNKNDLLFLFDKILNDINKVYFEKNKICIKYFFLKTVIWYTLYSCKNTNIDIVYKNYLDFKKYITKNISECYKGIIKFNPKGENIGTKLVIVSFVILDKLKLLKFFIKIYSKI